MHTYVRCGLAKRKPHLCVDGTTCRHTSNDLNPAGQPVKVLEMTLVRALKMIHMFDALEDDEDWTDLTNQELRKVFQFHYAEHRQIEEMWKSYQSGSLAQQVLDLYENLPKDIWKIKKDYNPSRKRELKGRRDDIATLRKEDDRSSNRRLIDSTRGRRDHREA